jgi:hypothetical protein
VLPLLQQELRLLNDRLAVRLVPVHAASISCILAYGLLSGLCDVLVRFEERSDVQGLATPDVPVDGPVERELEGTAVEGAGRAGVSVSPRACACACACACRGRRGAAAYRTWVRAADMAAAAAAAAEASRRPVSVVRWVLAVCGCVHGSRLP